MRGPATVIPTAKRPRAPLAEAREEIDPGAARPRREGRARSADHHDGVAVGAAGGAGHEYGARASAVRRPPDVARAPRTSLDRRFMARCGDLFRAWPRAAADGFESAPVTGDLLRACRRRTGVSAVASRTAHDACDAAPPLARERRFPTSGDERVESASRVEARTRIRRCPTPGHSRPVLACGAQNRAGDAASAYSAGTQSGVGLTCPSVRAQKSWKSTAITSRASGLARR